MHAIAFVLFSFKLWKPLAQEQISWNFDEAVHCSHSLFGLSQQQLSSPDIPSRASKIFALMLLSLNKPVAGWQIGGHISLRSGLYQGPARPNSHSKPCNLGFGDILVRRFGPDVRLSGDRTSLHSRADILGKFTRLDSLRAMVIALVTAYSLRAAPAFADGLDDALRLCRDDRVSCISSLDPGHLLEPWSYDEPLDKAVKAVTREAKKVGGKVVRDDSSSRGIALRVNFPDSDEAIFWFPFNDAVVQFRSERMDGSLWDFAANKGRLDNMRNALGFEPVRLVRGRLPKPGELQPDGSFKLEEEKPWLRADGKLYGDQGGSPYGQKYGESGLKSGQLNSPAGYLKAFTSPEPVQKLLFPFDGLGGTAQKMYDDLSDVTSLQTGSAKVYMDASPKAE